MDAESRLRRFAGPAHPTPSDRLLGWLMMLGGALMFAGRLRLAAGQLDDFAPWWNALAGSVPVLVLVLVVAGWFLPMRVLRILWIAVFVLLLLALATVFAAYEGADPDALLPWIWTFEASVICLPVLLFRAPLVVALAVLTPLLPLVSGLVFVGGAPETVVLNTPLHVGNIAFVALFLGIRARLGRLTDAEATARAQQDEKLRAQVAAARQEDLARVVHDEVLSTLTAAMRLPGPIPSALRTEAQHALAVLERVPSRSSAPVASEAAVHELRSTASRIAPEARTHLEDAGGAVPGDVLEHIRMAMAEALRNSLRHAGAGVPIRVRGEIASDRVRVVVEDDGAGFDVDGVAPGRWGVRASILGRMQSLDGGDARVASGPGGTEVELLWRR